MCITSKSARTTLIFGFSLASLHFCWALIVASGWAQAILDFIFKLHMLSSPFQVQPFSLALAASLVAITFLIGCFYGMIFHCIKHKIEGE